MVQVLLFQELRLLICLRAVITMYRVGLPSPGLEILALLQTFGFMLLISMKGLITMEQQISLKGLIILYMKRLVASQHPLRQRQLMMWQQRI